MNEYIMKFVTSQLQSRPNSGCVREMSLQLRVRLVMGPLEKLQLKLPGIHSNSIYTKRINCNTYYISSAKRASIVCVGLMFSLWRFYYYSESVR